MLPKLVLVFFLSLFNFPVFMGIVNLPTFFNFFLLSHTHTNKQDLKRAVPASILSSLLSLRLAGATLSSKLAIRLPTSALNSQNTDRPHPIPSYEKYACLFHYSSYI